MSNQYHTKSMWKIACFHMVFAKWFHAHTWYNFWIVKIQS
jgi:hypothetical protein